MHSLLGNSLMLVALFSSAFGSILAFAKHSRWAQKSAYVYSGCMLIANGVMIHALLQHDFSVKYVAQVGSKSTPLWVTIVSLWSSLEGSILFWGLILGGYIAAFVALKKEHPNNTYALGFMLLVATFFTFLVAAPANPFTAISPVPEDGPGPNALLQNHILMSIHPPMLYLGYVGMTVPFGMAMAALLRGHLSKDWLQSLRAFTMIPWMFLSVGILLGGLWAYEVLGWGGYWAWDPVENASFLPWLTATAYLHAAVVNERKRLLKLWTLTLVVGTFLLTILGTFMTRSGVFNSVHSFTQSAIGPIFLGFFTVALVASIVLLVGRGHLLQDEGQVQNLASRETAFLLNNLVFVVFTLTVLLGTIFPLINEAIRSEQISVGEPYFNRMAIPLGMLLVFLMGVGPLLPWGKSEKSLQFAWPLLGAVCAALACLYFSIHSVASFITLSLCGFAFVVTLQHLIKPFEKSLSLGKYLRSIAGYVVHLGIIGIVVAIVISQQGRISKDASLVQGENVIIGPYRLHYVKTEAKQESHRLSIGANIEIFRDNKRIGQMFPKLNFYPTQREPVATPHVETYRQQDLYLSLLSFDPNDPQQRIGLKVFLIPYVSWIWKCLPLLVLGSLFGLWPRKFSRENA